MTRKMMHMLASARNLGVEPLHFVLGWDIHGQLADEVRRFVIEQNVDINGNVRADLALPEQGQQLLVQGVPAHASRDPEFDGEIKLVSRVRPSAMTYFDVEDPCDVG